MEKWENGKIFSLTLAHSDVRDASMLLLFHGLWLNSFLADYSSASSSVYSDDIFDPLVHLHG